MGKIPKELRRIIAANIRACRKKRFPGHGGGKQCAAEFGVSAQQWSPWERGTRTPDDTRMRQLAEFFGVSVAYLYEENGNSVADPQLFLRSRRQRTAATGKTAPPSPTAVGGHCPLLSAPSPGQPNIGAIRSLYGLVEQLITEIKERGLPIRLHLDVIEMLLNQNAVIRKKGGAMDAISEKTVKARFEEVMDAVCKSQTPMIITRQDKDPLVLISLDRYNQIHESASLLIEVPTQNGTVVNYEKSPPFYKGED